MKKVQKLNQVAAKLGFTLIELSIVLVIIGLLVGGILVGRDLIKAAEVRGTVSQMEKYTTAVNTFRSKYNGIPGDILNASNFGFDASRGASMGDGDGVIESVQGSAGSFAGETSCFWDDLTAAALIGDGLNSSTACGTSTATNLAISLPQTKLGRGNYIIVGNTGGINYWAITGITALGATAGWIAPGDLLTNEEAFQIDSKIDDGGPTAGSVMTTIDEGVAAAGSGQALFNTLDGAAASAAGVCVGPTGIYDFTTSGGKDQSCQLRIRATF